MKYFLDTNIIIYAIRNTFPSVKDYFLKVPAQAIVIPSVVIAEIEYGARKSFDYERTILLYDRFLDAFEKADFDERAAVEYGDIRADLERKGQPIRNNDLMIASIVRAQAGTLVTHNLHEFERVEGLRVVDWTV